MTPHQTAAPQPVSDAPADSPAGHIQHPIISDNLVFTLQATRIATVLINITLQSICLQTL